jgi:hypothetical protein
LVCLVFVACGGASAGDLFDNPKPANDAAAPTATVPTSTTTTDPPPPPPDDLDGAVPPPVAECSGERPNCPNGFVCEVPGCSGDGKCVSARTFGADPVCGCDKLTYANVALVKNEAVRGSGECTKDAATTCTGSCSNGAKCNVPVANALACVEATGTCWKMPQTCPAMPKKFRSCGQVPCTSACDAVLLSRKYYADALCP